MKKVIFSQQLFSKSKLIIRENFLRILVIMKMVNWLKNMQMRNAMEKMIKMLLVILVHVTAMFIILNL